MLSNKKITVSFTYRTILRVVFVILATVLFLLALAKISHVLSLIFVSFFLCLALNPVVSWIAKHLKSRSRVRATGAAYLLVLLFISGFLLLVVPTVTTQTSKYIRSLPDTFNNYTEEDSTVIRFIREYNLEDDINLAANNIKDKFINSGDSVINTANRIWGITISIVVVLAMTFMMLVEGPQWLKYFWSLQDPKDTPKRKKTISKMYRVVTGYVNGQLTIAVIAGAAAFIGLLVGKSIFGGDINPVVYALIISVTGLIPMFGATLGALIVVLLCSLTSLPLAIAMAIFFLAYQQLENVTIQPLIQSWQSELTPLIVFISALIGIGFGGILGAFVAIPVAACIKILVLEHFGHDMFNIEEKLINNKN